MKPIYFLLTVLFFAASCGTTKQSASTIDLSQYQKFGDEALVSNQAPMSTAEARKAFNNLGENEEKPLRFEAQINDVCEKKGCWMVLDLGEGDEATITFKDYAFFVPKDASGRTTIVDGIAKRKVASVERLKHLAEDAGKSEEEIAAITEPKETFTFEATNVLIKR